MFYVPGCGARTAQARSTVESKSLVLTNKFSPHSHAKDEFPLCHTPSCRLSVYHDTLAVLTTPSLHRQSSSPVAVTKRSNSKGGSRVP